MAGLTTQANLETLSQVSAQLTHMFKKDFVEVLNDEATLWRILPKRKASGEAVRVKFHVGRNTGGGATTETGSVGTAGYQAFHSAYTDFAIYTKPIEVTDLMMAKAMASGHDGYEAWKDEVARAAADMRRDLEEALWGAQSGNSSLGVQDALDDGQAVASYLGLARADYPFLKCITLDAISGQNPGPLSFALLRELFRKVHHGTGADLVGDEMTFKAADQGGGRVDVLVTTPEIESVFEALVTANGRYPIPPVVNRRVDPGLTDLSYKGAALIGSRFCPDNNLFALDLATWGIEILPQVLVGERGERLETDFALILEGRTGQKVTAFWRVYFQLVCERPWRNGRIVNLSHTEPQG
ncbi:MAG: phage major capsid protein [Planctomycetes bacterium]|nr:phage major capsid protein [Planctomycetota bacterium]